MVLDLMCLAAFHAKARSASSDSVGARRVTVFQPEASSSYASTVWSSTPPDTGRTSSGSGPEPGGTRSTRRLRRLRSRSSAPAS